MAFLFEKLTKVDFKEDIGCITNKAKQKQPGIYIWKKSGWWSMKLYVFISF